MASTALEHVRTDSGASDATLNGSTPSSSAFVDKSGALTSPLPADGKTSPTIPDVIPPAHPNRTLVLCFDGTGDQFDADNSNIVQLFSMLKKDDRNKQMVYYQSGIGTYTSPHVATPIATKISKTLDEAVAWNLDEHVMDGYDFLMQNYTAGDRICLFGFSRGAYTARSLAGMIHKVGLLPPCNFQQVPFAYKMYTTTDDDGWKQANAFKKAFSIDVDIEFIGVWDTVDSVGLIPKRLPFTTSNTIVRTFRHAVALDERRAKFKANLWNRPTSREQGLSVTDQEIQKVAAGAEDVNKKHANGNGKAKARRNDSLRALERKYGRDLTQTTDIEEVWFAGCHCDVGGGSVSNETAHSLARIPLRWMIRECFKTNTGILFHSEALAKIGLNPASLYPIVAPRPPALAPNDSPLLTIADITKRPELFIQLDATASQVGTEEAQDLRDALSPIYDQLSLNWSWWTLEVLPLKFKYQKGDDSWSSYFGMNMGSGRYIPRQRDGVKVHRTVLTRMNAKTKDGEGYRPVANLDLQYVKWVD